MTPRKTKAPVSQIVKAVEAVKGDLADVTDLIETWERMHDRLDHCNTLDREGKTAEAEHVYVELEHDFAKPIQDIAREHIEKRRAER